MKALWFALAMAGYAAGLFGQDKPFRTELRVVLVPVTVTDERGRFVNSLSAEDFRLVDNGVLQRVTLDTLDTGVAPISLAVAIQSSGISAAALTKVRRIGSMIPPLIVGDRGEAAVLTFDRDIRWRQDFTSDPDAIGKAFAGIRLGDEKTARMLDALVEAAERIGTRKGRRVVLLISESRDRGSKKKLTEAIQVAQRTGIAVYSAQYSVYTTPFTVKQDEVPPPSGPDFLAIFTELGRLGKANAVRALAEATGGAEYRFLTQHSLEAAIEKLGEEVHSQYILSFTPRSESAGYHQLEVVAPHHGDYKIRARQGYWIDD